MRYIDLRSDTVTQPTSAMREAMAAAAVDDDVFGDDPTVNDLQRLAAERLGKEAALFVPSGTQGNAVAVLANTRRGDSIIMSRICHIADHEAGSYAMLAGVSPCYVDEVDGVLLPGSVEAAIRDGSDYMEARTGLICLENALSNGNVASVENLAQLYNIAQKHSVPIHLDGARVFNAAHYLGVDVREITRYCDTVMCCLSKGLCAPVGSVVAGDAAFIGRARKWRKVLGGGMRQAGVLAAAGIVALRDMIGRIPEDHVNARYLAERLLTLPGVTLDPASVKINMIFFRADWPESVVATLPDRMLRRGIRILPPSGGMFRFVTNHGVSRKDCDTAVTALREYIET